jgi:hypothetical protein
MNFFDKNLKTLIFTILVALFFLTNISSVQAQTENNLDPQFLQQLIQTLLEQIRLLQLQINNLQGMVTKIKVLSPNGGETFISGSSMNIRWIGDNSTSTVGIQLLKSNNFYATVTINATNTGYYNWQIPTNFATGTDYKIKIFYENNNIFDESDSFFQIISNSNDATTSTTTNNVTTTTTTTTTTTATVSLQVISPNGGETFYKDSLINIRWTFSGNISDKVLIELLKGNVLYMVIGSNISNTGSYTWQAPANFVTANDYKIRIRDQVNRNIFDQSDNYFSIVNFPYNRNALKVTNPNKVQIFTKGSRVNITWESLYTPKYSHRVSIQLYKGGVFYATITPSIVDRQYYSWVIPETIYSGDDYRIRITSVMHPLVFDESDAPFIIADKESMPFIKVISPNGRESFVKGSVMNITWNPGAVSSTVSIILYDQSRIYSYIFIDRNAPNSGFYSWLIPSNLLNSPYYKIKIVSNQNNDIFDESDSFFTISGPRDQRAFLKVVSPNGDEKVFVGRNNVIRWTFYDPSASTTISTSSQNNLIPKVDIYLDRLINNSFVEVGKITSTSTSDLFINWNGRVKSSASSEEIEPEAGSNYYINIVDTVKNLYDRSDKPFTIVPSNTNR